MSRRCVHSIGIVYLLKSAFILNVRLRKYQWFLFVNIIFVSDSFIQDTIKRLMDIIKNLRNLSLIKPSILYMHSRYFHSMITDISTCRFRLLCEECMFKFRTRKIQKYLLFPVCSCKNNVSYENYLYLCMPQRFGQI